MRLHLSTSLTTSGAVDAAAVAPEKTKKASTSLPNSRPMDAFIPSPMSTAVGRHR
ncbi:hypothetical protein [Sodalis sp.]|uniref:hypothetical protein n=1 Tax=Sodalis sp. (in: enterobacteria) TaxID=1898979 RepID=UPI00387335A1